MKAAFSITSGEIAAVTGGRILCGGSGISVGDVTTDSREPAGLYIPIIGENFDGHDFIEELCKSGNVKCCMTMKAGYESIAQSAESGLILCDDTLKALGALGRHHREKFRPLMTGVGGARGASRVKLVCEIPATMPRALLSRVTLKVTGPTRSGLGAMKLPLAALALALNCPTGKPARVSCTVPVVRPPRV